MQSEGLYNMKIILLSLTVIGFALAGCETKADSKINLVDGDMVKNNNTELDFRVLQSGSSIEDLLKAIGLTIKDNASPDMYYDMSGDIEEFQIPEDKKTSLSIGKNYFSESDDISIFYVKENKRIFAFELELFNHKNPDEIISSITKTIESKPAYFNKLISTKEKSVLFDENGELEVDRVEEVKQVWEDLKSKNVYFLINYTNYSKGNNVLKIYVLDKASPIYKRWVSYRGFDMFYNE